MSQSGSIGNGGGGGGAITTITGNDGVPESPSAGNFNIVTANSTVKFIGTSATETLDFGLDNIILGTDGSTITTASASVGIGAAVFGALTSGARNISIGQASSQSLTEGLSNIVIGTVALAGATAQSNNIAIGDEALFILSAGTGQNLSIGNNSLQNLVGGESNIVMGHGSGGAYNASESSNILIGNNGVAGESHIIRVGTTGSSSGQQNKCFVAGITGATPTSANTPQVVLCDNAGNLAPISSSTAGFVLTSNGTATPSFQAPAGSFNGFLAYLSGNVSNVTGDNTTYTVAFDSTSYNTGTNFNTGTFTYTAPTTGSYAFGGVIYGFGYGAGHTQQSINLVTTATTFAMYTVNPFLMSGNSTLVVPFSQQCHMTAGDTATITVNVNNSTKTIGIGGVLGLSSFWGQFLG